MEEDFKIFLADKDISEEKYGGMTDKLKFKWSELFEKSKLQVAGMIPKSYFITNWKTAEVNLITYQGSFEKFIFQIGVVFRVGVNRRLYALKPGVEQDQKVHITNKAELEEIFKYIDENEECRDALQ
eukprot:gene61697-84385_t